MLIFFIIMNWIRRLDPGIIPHPAIVLTLGKLAAVNPYGMLPFVKITLTIMLPMLNHIREETLKQAICFSKYMLQFTFFDRELTEIKILHF